MTLVYQLRDQYAYYAASIGQKIVALWDISEMGTPDADTRKRVAELAREADEIEGYITVVMIVNSPLLRGVVTAVMWVAGDKLKGMQHARSGDVAVAKACRLFSEHNIEWPEIPSPYSVPEWDDNRETVVLKSSDIKWTLENRERLFRIR